MLEAIGALAIVIVIISLLGMIVGDNDERSH